MKTKHLKPLVLCVISSFGFVQADIIEFKLSPLGTDNAVGLRPANEFPAIPVPSTGSGGEISGGISFDTATSTLTFAMGFGSAAGFTDLTGEATDLHIHGPAATGASAPPLFDLEPMLFAAADDTKGGVIFGSVVYTAPQAASLLAGLNYVNIHTVDNPAGEIRGQLIRQNASPGIIPPADATVECGVNVTFTATVSDFDGDAVQVVWTVDGLPVQTENIAAEGPPTSEVLTFTGKLRHEGVKTLTVTATDSAGNISIASAQITVEDTIPPVIQSLTTNPKVLWPPNHKMVDVRVKAKVTDACDGTTWKIVSVKSNQAVDAPGSGNTAPDWRITGDHTVSLRAERSGKDKGGRVYTIKVRAKDEAGNVSGPEIVKVTVPHDQGKNN